MDHKGFIAVSVLFALSYLCAGQNIVPSGGNFFFRLKHAYYVWYSESNHSLKLSLLFSETLLGVCFPAVC